jgi:hypothetical protein
MPRILWAVLVMVLAAAIALVGVPVLLLQPFSPQGPSYVPWAWTLRRAWAPAGTIVCAAILVVGLASGWKRTKRLGKTGLVLLATLGVGAAWFARQNHFEWMFNPLPAAAYARAGEVDFLADTDMVLAVEVNGESVAYPVRLMAYHHLVADTVGGQPVVATY